MDAINSLLATLGLLFFIFLVLAAAVEGIVELLRGALESCGFTVLKGKYSVDEALKLANEFATGDVALKAKLEALNDVAQQIKTRLANEITSLQALKEDFSRTVNMNSGEAAARLNAVAGSIKRALDSNERQRIFILRALSALLGYALVSLSDFQLFALLAQSSAPPGWLSKLGSLDHVHLDRILAGLGAAAGSSYWHDQLDRIRNLKSAEQQFSILNK